MRLAADCMILPRNKNLKLKSNILRKNTTKQENRLWYDFLKKHHFQFYRQRVIGNYIVDFYCHKAKLVIELDGSQHYEKKAEEYDVLRTEYLNSLKIYVLRFSNKDIDNNFEGVCKSIENTILSQLR